MFKNIVFIYFLLTSTFVMSQDNQQQLSLEDLIPGGKSFSKYRPKTLPQLQWCDNKLIYTNGDNVISISTDGKKTEEILFSKDEINNLIPDNKEKLKFLGYISIPDPNKAQVLINSDKKFILYDFSNHKIVESFSIDNNSENIDFSSNASLLAYTQNNNLYLFEKGNKTAITTEDNIGIVSGQSVHRNEFGIQKGTFWSPTGKSLAFYKMDETMVTDYPLVDISERVAKLKDIKYPMAGMKSHQVRVGIYNKDTKDSIFLKTGLPKEKYLTNIAWSPNEDYLYIAELNRGQDTCNLVRYNTINGQKEKILFTETSSKYVEPEHPVQFTPNNSENFVWQSKRDGYNHLYLYNTNGDLIKQITSGDWNVTEVLGFDKDGKNIYYISTEASPIEKHIYEVNLKTGKRKQLSAKEGIHRAILSPNKDYIADIYTSQYNPGTVDVINLKNKKTENVFQAENPYEGVALPQIKLGSLKANDNETDLYYRMILPTNFDPQKKYPLIVYVYGGPHSQLVDNSWMAQARGWDVFMAEKGYIVFTLDNRGTSNRGLDFENITHRHLGVIETEDQMTGVNYLKSLPYVDSDRIGVHGWSFGGFMTLNLMLRHPETFKVGVAGGPVTDWKYYEIMYGERYMDSPKKNPEGYKECSMVDRAGDLKGRLMLIHGDEDPTVVMQHSLQFLKSAINKGTHPDFFIYPGHGHNMIGKDRVHLHEHITRYFDDFLK